MTTGTSQAARNQLFRTLKVCADFHVSGNRIARMTDHDVVAVTPYCGFARQGAKRVKAKLDVGFLRVNDERLLKSRKAFDRKPPRVIPPLQFSLELKPRRIVESGLHILAR